MSETWQVEWYRKQGQENQLHELNSKTQPERRAGPLTSHSESLFGRSQADSTWGQSQPPVTRIRAVSNCQWAILYA